MKIFAIVGLLAAFTLTASLPASADVGPTRFQKEYAKVVYDFAVDGGALGAHPSIVTLPAGILVTNIMVYTNTTFTGAAGASVGIGCVGGVGSADLFAAHDVTLAPADFYYAGVLNATAFSSGSSAIPYGGPALHSDNGKSTPSDCTVTTYVTNGAITAGKHTAIIEYFRK